MRIAHVVTYVSPDGAFGGPVSVALGQAQALAERGHDVTVYAAAPARIAGTSHKGGITLKTYPARRLAPVGGFAVVSAPGLTAALAREASSFDVAHIHLARDLVTMPAAAKFRKARVPYVVQPHGMIDASANLLVKPLDEFVTKRLLRAAATSLVLTAREADDISAIEPSARIARISNGIRVGELAPYEGRENVVLFLARLHPRKRALAFVQMARALDEALPGTKFVIAGPDEGDGDAVRSAIADAAMGERLQWIGAVPPDETGEMLASVRAFVLPSFGEVFPMTILESLRVGTPVVTTHSLGIATECERYGAAVITDGSVGELAEAVVTIISSNSEAARLRAGGLNFLRRELDIANIAAILESHYARTREASSESTSTGIAERGDHE